MLDIAKFVRPHFDEVDLPSPPEETPDAIKLSEYDIVILTAGLVEHAADRKAPA